MPATAIEIVGVALPESKFLKRQAQRIGRDLGIGGFMALAIGMGTNLQIDLAVFAETCLRHFVGLAARGFEKAGIAETAQLSLCARAFPARLESRGGCDRVIDRVGKAALLDRKPHGAGVRKTADDVLAPQIQRIHAKLGG